LGNSKLRASLAKAHSALYTRYDAPMMASSMRWKRYKFIEKR